MSQHFLLTAAARTVSLKQILRMKEAEAWTMFCSKWVCTSHILWLGVVCGHG